MFSIWDQDILGNSKREGGEGVLAEGKALLGLRERDTR